METLLAAGIVAALSILASYWFVQTKDPLSPAGLQAGLWALICFGYLVLPHQLNPLSLRTYLVILCGSLSFSAGTYLIDRPTNERLLSGPPPRRLGSFSIVRLIAVWLPILVFPLVVQRAFELAELAPISDSPYINLRFALSVQETGRVRYGLLAYAIPISFGSVMVELALSRKRFFEPQGWIALMFSFGYAILSTGRTFFALLLIGIAGILMLSGRVRPAHVAPVVFFLLLAVFFAQGQALDKLGMTTYGEGALHGAVRTFSVYILGSLPAFDHVNASLDLFELSASHTFRSVYAILYSMGFNVEVAELVQDFVYVPEPTNVYSVFQPYALDFGLAGAVIAMLPLGAMHAALRRAARTHDPRYIVAYPLTLYPLAMQFFQDQYMSLLTTWIILGTLVFFAIRPSRRTEAT